MLFSTFFSEMYLILRRIQRDIIITVNRSSCFVRFTMCHLVGDILCIYLSVEIFSTGITDPPFFVKLWC
jgi:hypothetical protein